MKNNMKMISPRFKSDLDALTWASEQGWERLDGFAFARNGVAVLYMTAPKANGSQAGRTSKWAAFFEASA